MEVTEVVVNKLEVKRLPFTHYIGRNYRIQIGDELFDNRDLLELCQSLDNVDGYMEAIRITKKDVREKLTKLGLISTNIKGGSHGTPELTAILEDISEAYWKEDVPNDVQSLKNLIKKAEELLKEVGE